MHANLDSCMHHCVFVCGGNVLGVCVCVLRSGPCNASVVIDGWVIVMNVQYMLGVVLYRWRCNEFNNGGLWL